MKTGSRYFIIKAQTAHSFVKAFESQIWSVPFRRDPPQPAQFLNAALQNGPVILIGSISGSKAFQGYAEMIEPINEDEQVQIDDGKGTSISVTKPFRVAWAKKYPNLDRCPGLPFSALQGADLPLSLLSNCQEISADIGAHLCSLIDTDVALVTKKEIEYQQEQEAKKEEKRLARTIPQFSDWTAESANWTDEEVVTNFLSKLSDFCPVVHVSVYGSKRYNTTVQQSDLDLLAIIILPISYSIGISAQDQTFKNPEGSKHDFSIHSIQCFMQLLQQGDTKMVETVYQDAHSTLYSSSIWNSFVTMATKDHIFQTKQFVNKYITEVEGIKGIKKIRKMINENPSEPRLFKTWYIVFRCLVHANQVVCGIPLQVWLKDDDPNRLFLLAVRNQQFSNEDLLQRFTTELATIKKNILSFSPPSSMDGTGILNDWLLCHHPSLINSDAISVSLPTNVVSLLSTHKLDITNNTLLFLANTPQGLIGVYSNSIYSLLAVDPPKAQTITPPKEPKPKGKGANKAIKEAPPPTLHELSRFFEQVVKGFPLFFICILWARPEDVIYSHPMWEHILAIKQQCITARLLRQCFGWISNNLARMKATSQMTIDGWMLDGILRFISLFCNVGGLPSDHIQPQIDSLIQYPQMDVTACQRLETLMADAVFMDYAVLYRALPHEANLYRVLDDIAIKIRESTYQHQ